MAEAAGTADAGIIDLAPESYRVRDLWIPMPDGVRLHARAWMPADVEQHPAPVLLEYLPYRLDDWTSVRDSERHPFYAAHGYVSVRVDIRGSGSSDGQFTDEYSSQELDDGEAVIRWLADQPWSTGRVGMFGISWGGFNSLQLAERGIDALQAIVTVCSTDDRYDNDVHYIGGAVLGIDMAAWAGTMHAFAARPPRPEVVGPGWVEQWRDRLDQHRPLGAVWLSHQERDGYWQRGSVCENYAGISAAVLAVGGWADPYHDAVLRLLEHLDGPRKAILGPWSHQYPDRGLAPGPGIDFLGETLRWWDRWLKDEPTGVEDDPDLRVWINESEPPATYYENRAGGWIGIPHWRGQAPGARHPLTGLTGLAGSDTTGSITVASPAATGQDAGRFFPFGNATDLPPDQRAEDGRSRCVDLPVGERPLGFLGSPLARLRVRLTGAGRAHLIVRLCDVGPDGASTLITRGVLNLTKRHGMDRSEEMPAGAWQDVTVRLVSAGHRLAPGHTLRVAISDQYWPWVWPHGERSTVELDPTECWLDLPGDPQVPGGSDTSGSQHPSSQKPSSQEPGGQELVPVDFAPARRVRPLPIGSPPMEPSDHPERMVQTDVGTGETLLRVDPAYGGSRVYPDGLVYTEQTRESYRIREDDPASASAESEWQMVLSNDSAVGRAHNPWRAEITSRSLITATATEYRVQNWLTATARDGDEPARELLDRHWDERVPRTSA